MTAAYTSSDGPLDPAETLIRARLEASVGDVLVDGAPLIGDGLAAGRGLRRRRIVRNAVATAATVALVAAAGVSLRAGVFDNDSQPAVQGTSSLVASTPRAMTAAVLAHVPSGVHVVWSTAKVVPTGLLPGQSPAGAKGDRSVDVMILLTDGPRQTLLSVSGDLGGVSHPATRIVSQIKRDKQGRVLADLVVGGASGAAVIESAGPGAVGRLPLSDAQLRAIAADRLVGNRTSPAMIRRGQNVPSFTTHPPALSWSAVTGK